MRYKALKVFEILEKNKGKVLFIESNKGEVFSFDDFSYNYYDGIFYFYALEYGEIISKVALEETKGIYSSKNINNDNIYSLLVKDKLLMKLQ